MVPCLLCLDWFRQFSFANYYQWWYGFLKICFLFFTIKNRTLNVIIAGGEINKCTLQQKQKHLVKWKTIATTHMRTAVVKTGRESEQRLSLLSTSHSIPKSSTRSDSYQPLLLLWHWSICLSPCAPLNGFAQSTRAAYLFVVHISCLKGRRGTGERPVQSRLIGAEASECWLVATFLPSLPNCFCAVQILNHRMNNAEHFDDAQTVIENNHTDIKRRMYQNNALMCSLRKLCILPILYTLTSRFLKTLIFNFFFFSANPKKTSDTKKHNINECQRHTFVLF